jgi:hypothetical protein
MLNKSKKAEIFVLEPKEYFNLEPRFLRDDLNGVVVSNADC